jgi:hypothetical protein
MQCPFPITPRAGFRGIYGGSDPDEEAESGYFESDWAWMDANREACIWFLRQHTKDPVDSDD